MGDGVDFAITGSEEGAQDPTYEANDNRPEEGAPESIYGKRGNDLGDEHQQQGIDHQNEKSHRHDDKRHAQEQQDGSHESVNDPQEKRGPKKSSGTGAVDAWNNFLGGEHRDSRHQPAD